MTVGMCRQVCAGLTGFGKSVRRRVPAARGGVSAAAATSGPSKSRRPPDDPGLSEIDDSWNAQAGLRKFAGGKGPPQ